MYQYDKYCRNDTQVADIVVFCSHCVKILIIGIGIERFLLIRWNLFPQKD